MTFYRHKRTALHELIRREYGVKCSWWTSIQALRHMAFGPRRRWVKLLQTKENSMLEMSGDLMWITHPGHHPNGSQHKMMRVLGDGRTMRVYNMELESRATEVEIYEIPHPVFCNTIPQKEYQPVMFVLRKNTLLTRHNLDTGEEYNRLRLRSPVAHLSINFVTDLLVGKSNRLYQPGGIYYRFHVFQLHPFGPLACFDIHSTVFPGEEDKSKYGKLRSAEIHDGLLLIMTDRSYTLIYNAEDIIKSKVRVTVAEQGWSEGVWEDGGFGGPVQKAPPLLFVTYAHSDILGLGACPWAYLTALSDDVIQVYDLGSQEVIEGGRIKWEEWEVQQITPDYLMFHPDDSSRLIHVRTHQIRILNLVSREDKRYLEEEFTFPERDRESQEQCSVQYSKRGRPLVSRYRWDDTLNTALTFNVEADLRLLVILEARRDTERNCTRLKQILFYDSLTHERLGKEEVGVWVDGDIETNRLSVSIDRDILNIVSHKGTVHTILSYRLKEVFESEGEEEEKKKRGRGRRRKKREDEDEEDGDWKHRDQRRSGGETEEDGDEAREEDESPGRNSDKRENLRQRRARNRHVSVEGSDDDADNRKRGSRKRTRTNNEQRRRGAPRRTRTKRRRSSTGVKASSNESIEDSDEWLP